jgi:hypothetical protein
MKVLLFILFLPIFCFSQTDSLIIKKIYTTETDTFVISDIQEVEILRFKNNADRVKYYQLKRKTLKVYPYALLTANKLDSIYTDLDGISKKKKRKRYIKAVESWAKEEYSAELKKLTRSEGRILTKLIYRETNISSYDILKELRGGFKAFIWQSVAKMYDNDLKAPYQPLTEKEDKMIEHIILQAQLQGNIK